MDSICSNSGFSGALPHDVVCPAATSASTSARRSMSAIALAWYSARRLWRAFGSPVEGYVLVGDRDQLVFAQLNVHRLRLAGEADAVDLNAAWSQRTTQLNDPPTHFRVIPHPNAVT